MQLSRELFKQIVAQLKGTCSDSDKRKSPRVGLRNHVEFRLLKASDPKTARPCKVMVRDLSPDGIGLLHSHKVAVDGHFAIRLPANDSTALLAIYRVEHCEVVDEGLFRIGASLLRICDSEAEVAPVARPKVANSNGENKPATAAAAIAASAGEKDQKAQPTAAASR